MHVGVIISVWAVFYQLFNPMGKLVFAYSLVIWPMGYGLKFALRAMAPKHNMNKVEHGGKLIGQFERIIILTFVLLNQYEAIRLLTIGKGNIRFA